MLIWLVILFSPNKVYMLLLLLSRFSCVRLCATQWTASHQAPPSLGFSRQEHWSGLPFPSPMHESEMWKWSRSVVSDSSRPHGLQPTRPLRPWDFPGKSTGVGCHCFNHLWTVVLEKTPESPLDCKEIQPVHSEGDQPWDFFGRNDTKAETPILWPPHAKSWLIGKDSDAGRDWGQKEKGTTEDEMAGWHHRLEGCESEWTPGAGDGHGGLACCNSWGRKESDTTEQLNWTELNWYIWELSIYLLNIHVESIGYCFLCFTFIQMEL